MGIWGFVHFFEQLLSGIKDAPGSRYRFLAAAVELAVSPRTCLRAAFVFALCLRAASVFCVCSFEVLLQMLFLHFPS